MRKLSVIAVLVLIVGVVWAGSAIGTSGCFYDCALAEEQPGSGGKCWVRFSVFHTALNGGCSCDHGAPDEVVFCHRYEGSEYWCYDTAERGLPVYHPELECWGYYYLSDWLEFDDDTTYDFYFDCEEGCYCESEVDLDC